MVAPTLNFNFQISIFKKPAFQKGENLSSIKSDFKRMIQICSLLFYFRKVAVAVYLIFDYRVKDIVIIKVHFNFQDKTD